jgi:RNA polymerase sigma-70 factor (ECF subfamily)
LNEKKFKHIGDQDLLDQYFKNKDNHSLGILLQRYTLLLLGVCMKYLKNEEAAKDAVQQYF